MDGFPSGQRGQTVNLLAMPSKVRILLHPLKCRCGSIGRAADLESAGYRFESDHRLLTFNNAGWSSLEARRAHNPKVIGSNPVPATYAQIAQLVEQRTENPRVAGSIPALGMF